MAAPRGSQGYLGCLLTWYQEMEAKRGKHLICSMDLDRYQTREDIESLMAAMYGLGSIRPQTLHVLGDRFSPWGEQSGAEFLFSGLNFSKRAVVNGRVLNFLSKRSQGTTNIPKKQ